MNYLHWIAGCALGLAWFWRFADAAVGLPKIADVSGPEWDRNPPGDPRVSIIVAACNEAADIKATLVRLLALEYDNYEVIAVDDRSTDRTGEIMERIAAASPDRLKTHPYQRIATRLDGQAARHVERKQPGQWRLAAFHRRRCSVQP